MHYPSTEEVLNSLGLSRLPAPSTASMWITPLAFLGVGLVAGATAAVLLTPKTGREVRHDLRDAATKAGSSISGAASWAGEHAMAALPHGRADADAPDEIAALGDNHTPAAKARAGTATVVK